MENIFERMLGENICILRKIEIWADTLFYWEQILEEYLNENSENLTAFVHDPIIVMGECLRKLINNILKTKLRVHWNLCTNVDLTTLSFTFNNKGFGNYPFPLKYNTSTYNNIPKVLFVDEYNNLNGRRYIVRLDSGFVEICGFSSEEAREKSSKYGQVLTVERCK